MLRPVPLLYTVANRTRQLFLVLKRFKSFFRVSTSTSPSNRAHSILRSSTNIPSIKSRLVLKEGVNYYLVFVWYSFEPFNQFLYFGCGFEARYWWSGKDCLTIRWVRWWEQACCAFQLYPLLHIITARTSFIIVKLKCLKALWMNMVRISTVSCITRKVRRHFVFFLSYRFWAAQSKSSSSKSASSISPELLLSMRLFTKFCTFGSPASDWAFLVAFLSRFSLEIVTFPWHRTHVSHISFRSLPATRFSSGWWKFWCVLSATWKKRMKEWHACSC